MLCECAAPEALLFSGRQTDFALNQMQDIAVQIPEKDHT
jgi:hypothetical protein